MQLSAIYPATAAAAAAMATPYEEFLARHILLGKVYDDLPPRIKAVVSPQDWKIR